MIGDFWTRSVRESQELSFLLHNIPDGASPSSGFWSEDALAQSPQPTYNECVDWDILVVEKN